MHIARRLNQREKRVRHQHGALLNPQNRVLRILVQLFELIVKFLGAPIFRLSIVRRFREILKPPFKHFRTFDVSSRSMRERKTEFGKIVETAGHANPAISAWPSQPNRR